MWEPRRLTTLWAFTAWDIFTFTLRKLKRKIKWKREDRKNRSGGGTDKREKKKRKIRKGVINFIFLF
jgi:hypothetical protein